MITKDLQKTMFIIKQDSNYCTDDIQPENSVYSRPDPPGVQFISYITLLVEGNTGHVIHIYI